MDSTTATLIIVFVALLFAVVIAIIALIKANKALQKSERQHMENISREVLRTYMGFEGGHRIRSIVCEELAKQQGKAVAQPPISQTQTSATPSTPVTTPAKTESTEPAKPAVEEKPEEIQRVPEEISLPKPVTLFTGSYSTGSFRHITSVPDEKTVFTIYTDNADAMEGVLNIDESAYAKVAQTPDYLKNACSYSGTGTQLRVIQTGKVVKENGTWKVTEPIIAELN